MKKAHSGQIGVRSSQSGTGGERVEHVFADRFVDLSPAPARVGERGAPPGGTDERGGGSRRGGLACALGIETKEDLNPDLLIRPPGGIVVRPRDFR